MLLYNHKQEFIGLDEESLKLLNYKSMGDLLNVCSDVADLFANEPGYIHNFKNFGWIDFLLHADSDASSAIVHANGRVFSCKLTVNPFYLSEYPLQSSYSINMTHIQTISGEDIKPHTIVHNAPKNFPKESVAPTDVKLESPSVLPDYSHITPTQLKEPTVLDIPNLEISTLDEMDESAEKTYFTPQTEEHLDDDLVDSPFKSFSYTEPEEPTLAPAPVAKKLPNKPMLGSVRYNEQEQACLERHSIAKNYQYDPHVAANELGLPVDLIEEFIGDFIQQSHDFKDSLFESSARSDFNNLHILSHKLKGVAANLRIEDAFETLSVINTSTDTIEIDANLKYFFDIIKKLSGEKVEEENVASLVLTEEADDDFYSFGLKQDEDELLVVEKNEVNFSNDPVAPLHEEQFEKVRLNILDDANDNTISLKESAPLSNELFHTEIPTDHKTDVNTTEIKLKEEPLLDTLDTITQNETNSAIIDPQDDELNIDSEITKIHYDKFFTAQILGIEPSFMEELLFDYKNDSRIISNQITEAIKAFDTLAWTTSAAKLKGISDNLRLNEISEELAILSKTHDAQEAKKASLRLNAYLDQL